MVSEKNLIWIDLEMTGLDPDSDVIIEIATVITDSNLHTLAEGPVLAIHQPNQRLEDMDQWNKSHHGKSGLLELVRASNETEASACRKTIEFLSAWVPPDKSPMCGNTICQDRRFMARRMPELERYFHYRNLDVSSLKILMQRWRPELRGGLKKVRRAPGAGRCVRGYRRTALLPPALYSTVTGLSRMTRQGPLHMLTHQCRGEVDALPEGGNYRF